ncbi:MAG: DUF1674 domain-containing protein [Rudaea sp.]
MNDANDPSQAPDTAGNANADSHAQVAKPKPKEIGGRGGLDPVRYGDWEKDGRCIDF